MLRSESSLLHSCMVFKGVIYRTSMCTALSVLL